ncbi:MAG: phosphoribosylanthranilate isomerase, partial [Rhodospirillaceae bacterium]|nr:phosphoribosylanthranilate isomerase [Rhodospirillaceae bacterium]
MTVEVKICGLNSREAVAAAVAGGARFLGFVFYPPSPRHVTPDEAAALAVAAPAGVARVGLFVDADDAAIEATLTAVGLDMLQLHGRETPARVGAIKARFGKTVMKAVPLAGAADLDAAGAYLDAADWLLFDAKPPPHMSGALPGGNALSFDWQLLAGRRWPRPWMLSGGLNTGNLPEAVHVSGATVVDVPSGVEDRPGAKSPHKIAAFLRV